MVNFKNLEDRVSDLEGWRIALMRGLNDQVIHILSKVKRQVEGLQNRIDNQNKFMGRNKCAYTSDGIDLGLRTERLYNHLNQRSNKDILNETRDDSNNNHKEDSPTVNSAKKDLKCLLKPIKKHELGTPLRTTSIPFQQNGSFQRLPAQEQWHFNYGEERYPWGEGLFLN